MSKALIVGVVVVALVQVVIASNSPILDASMIAVPRGVMGRTLPADISPRRCATGFAGGWVHTRGKGVSVITGSPPWAHGAAGEVNRIGGRGHETSYRDRNTYC